MSNMSEQKTEILDAAMRVITRFGLRKTTMRDIAEEAGVARQTVYNAFANKDDLLCDLIRHAGAQMDRDTRTALALAPELPARLEAFYEHALLVGFRAIQGSRQGESVEDSLSASGLSAANEVEGIKAALLHDIFADQSAALSEFGLSVAEMSEWVRFTCMGYKYKAEDEAQLRKLLQVLTRMILMVCNRPAG
jgi:AcrR family transcriptional regulator